MAKGGQELFPVQHSLLSSLALGKRVEACYNLPRPISCRFWYRGINDSYLIEAGESRFMLRVAPANWRSCESSPVSSSPVARS